MKCFHDPTQDAVGLCRACGKALSRDYLVDLDKGLACKGHCEDFVRRLIEFTDSSLAMNARTQNLIQSSGRASLATAMFILLIGAVFGGSALFYTDRPDPFLIAISSVFVLWGLFDLIRAISIQRTKVQ